MSSSPHQIRLDLLVIYSPDAALLERRHALGPSHGGITVGRASENTLVLHDNPVSRHHARFEERADGWWVIDGGSTNGTFVNDEQVREAPLRRGDRLRIGDTIFKLLHSGEPSGIVETTYSVSPVDGLTGANNRRHLVEQIDRELQRPDSPGPLALVLFDIDRFKKVNDTYGHPAGDQVLREIAALMRQHARPGDVVARYSGDELAFLLPGTSLQGAEALAEAIRAEVAGHTVPFQGHTISVTVSAGVAQANADNRTAANLLRSAAQNLHARRGDGP